MTEIDRHSGPEHAIHPDLSARASVRAAVETHDFKLMPKSPRRDCLLSAAWLP